MTNLPTGTVTFLFTDIQGSTPLWEREPEQMRLALERHHAILRKAIEAQGGQVYKIIGDAFQAAFDSPAQTVGAALAAQRGLAAEVWPTSAPILVRMGVHTGQAEARGDDYATTHTLNRAARIMSAGHGGQILISVEVAELARGYLPADVALRDLGQHRMKGMAQLEHLFQVVVPDLPANFPSLVTLDSAPNNLPVQLTSFVGRANEIAAVKGLLNSARLVTLTGSGGCGKTRLSLHVAGEVLANFTHGVWLAELAPLANPGLVPQTLVAALNLREDNRRTSLQVLTDYLGAKNALLILDNCEHVIEACAQLSQALLLACPKLKILASSREALGIAGETPYRVPSLKTPSPERLPSLEALGEMEAVRLFLERAAIVKPDLVLTKDNAAFVAQICFRLDGIPLAIELAAARVKVLSAEQIAVRLDDRFRLLTGGSRTALPRQQTLRAMIDWSYSLLSEPEKTLFRRLAVFVGGWTLEAAEFVCAADSIEQSEVLDLLTRLVDKSMVLAEDWSGETRYHRLETIRQYSREKFLETEEVEIIRDRHLDFYTRLAETADEGFRGPERVAWTIRLDSESDNLRSALDWGLARNPDSALRIVGNLVGYWTAGGYSVEGFQWTQQALQQTQTVPLAAGMASERRLAAQAKALRGLAWLYISCGDNANGQRIAEESVALYRQIIDGRGLAATLGILAMALEFQGEHARAEALLQESIALARAEQDTYTLCSSLSNLARVTAVRHGDLNTARRYLEESGRRANEVGIHWLVAASVGALGLLAVHRKDFDGARRLFEESIRAFQVLGANFNVLLQKSDLAHLERQYGDPQLALTLYRETIVGFRDVGQNGAVAHQLECFAFIAARHDQFSRAAQLLAAAEALREKAGTPMKPDEQPEYDQHLAAVREQVEPDTFKATWAEGRALTMEQAIELALENPPAE
jgi:predicted ATPase/class 3 adenylate cyclase